MSAATVTPVRTVGLWEIGQHNGGGWRQWYVRNVTSRTLSLIDFGDAASAGLPDNLADFTARDVATLRELAWREVSS